LCPSMVACPDPRTLGITQGSAKGSAPFFAPIAQLDRALVYGTRCRKFESSWARSLMMGGTRKRTVRPRLPAAGVVHAR
jgi:hypothetical protein